MMAAGSTSCTKRTLQACVILSLLGVLTFIKVMGNFSLPGNIGILTRTTGNQSTLATKKEVVSNPSMDWHPNITHRTGPMIKQDQESVYRFVTSSWNPNHVINGTIFRYLPGYRNPCWTETLPPGDSDMAGNSYLSFFKRSDPWEQYKYVTTSFREIKDVYNKMRTSGKNERFRCIPAVYLAGVHKAGTTDLYASLVEHPQIVAPVVKESNFWIRSIERGFTFRDYLQLYDPIAHALSTRKDSVTLDASPENFFMWNHTLYRGGEDGRGEGGERFLARDIHALHPGTRIIIILRNPVTWLFSLYRHVMRRRSNPDDFHRCMEAGVNRYRRCMEETGSDDYACAVEPMRRRACDVKHSVYHVYLREWFKVIPRGQIYVIKADDYYSDRPRVMGDIYRFLGLSDFKGNVKELRSGRRKKVGVKTAPMHEKTKQLLTEFTAPHNKKLAELLGDDRFLWKN